MRTKVHSKGQVPIPVTDRVGGSLAAYTGDRPFPGKVERARALREGLAGDGKRRCDRCGSPQFSVRYENR